MSIPTNNPTLEVIEVSNQVRQVTSPQVFVDVVTNNNFSYELRYYYRSQRGSLSGGLYRYLKTSAGAWLSRDLKEESGGVNLYNFVQNQPQNKIDAFGLTGNLTVGTFPANWYTALMETDSGKLITRYNFATVVEGVRGWWGKILPSEIGNCCGSRPASPHWARTDPPPNGWDIHMSFDLNMSGDYRKLLITWWTCYRRDGTSNLMPWSANSTVAFLPVYPLGESMYQTEADIRYLSCENCQWVLKNDRRGRNYYQHFGYWTYIDSY